MSTLSYLLAGFQTALSLNNIGAAALGAMLGIIVGAMPGIGSLVGVAAAPDLFLQSHNRNYHAGCHLLLQYVRRRVQCHSN